MAVKDFEETVLRIKTPHSLLWKVLFPVIVMILLCGCSSLSNYEYGLNRWRRTMNTKMVHDRRCRYITKGNDLVNHNNDEQDRKDGPGALLDMLAEVASQTLHSDPSVKMSPIKKPVVRIRDKVDQMPAKRKRAGSRSRSGEGDTMDLEHIRSLTANHLLKLFSEFDGDEIKRIFTYTCFMEPEQCHQQFSSFGSEGKARQQMKGHLLEHVQQLELKAQSGFHFTVESLKVQRRRLAEKLNGSGKRSKFNSKLKEEPSDENDSGLPNKENSMLVAKPCSKIDKVYSEDGNVNWTENDKVRRAEDMQLETPEKTSAKEEKHKEGELYDDVHEEHNYATCNGGVNQIRCLKNENKTDWDQMQGTTEEQDLQEESTHPTSASVPELGKFMMAEALRDTIMVCVMEDNQLQLKQLPCVGQEIDVTTCQPASYKMIRSDDLPVVKDNRKPDVQEWISDITPNKNIERDEYSQKKKPKGKAKFIGQSKAEKEMAIQLIETMKRKGSSDSLECHICNPPRSFTAPTTLISHYRSHAGIKPYECRICHSVFTRQHSLNYHMLIHSNQTRFTCTDCGRKFRHPSHFKEHRRRHTGESPYECSDCMLRFKTRNTYKRHLKTRHGKVLTTSGGLIILSEEEFRRVRTLPRSPNGTTNMNSRGDMHSAKKRARKAKGRIKSLSKRRQMGNSEITADEGNFITEKVLNLFQTAPDTEESFTVNNELGIAEQMDAVTEIVSDDITAYETEEEPCKRSFQDIVEAAMKQSSIPFNEEPEEKVVVLDVPATNADDIFSVKDVYHKDKTDYTMLSPSEENHWQAKSQTQLQQKKALILPNTVTLKSMMIKSSQANILPSNTKLSSQSLTFLTTQYASEKTNQEGLSTSPPQTTYMLLTENCNGFIQQHKYVMKDQEKSLVELLKEA